MRIKNNTVCNQSVYSAKGLGYMTVVGESNLELDDDRWLNEFAKGAAELIEAGHLEITKACKVSPEQQEAIDTKAEDDARALIAKIDAAKAAKETKKPEPKPEPKQG